MLVATVAIAAVAIPGGVGRGASPAARVVYRDSFTVDLPGRASGRMFTDTLSNPDDPTGKPPATAHVHTQLPAGARYDTGAIPACRASDAQIMAAGPSACPAASKVGTNQLVIDSGFPGSGRYAHEDVTFFNEAGGLILVSHDRASGAYLVFHAKVHGGSFDFDQPPLPGTPPDGGATKSEHGTFFVSKGASRRSYITTPPTCPASRIWRFRYEYTFRDGRKLTVTSDQRCRRRHGHRSQTSRTTGRGVPR